MIFFVLISFYHLYSECLFQFSCIFKTFNDNINSWINQLNHSWMWASHFNDLKSLFPSVVYDVSNKTFFLGEIVALLADVLVNLREEAINNLLFPLRFFFSPTAVIFKRTFTDIWSSRVYPSPLSTWEFKQKE